MAYRERMQQALHRRQAKGTLRTLEPLRAASESVAPDHAQTLCDFSSNDYLSLSQSEALRKRFIDSIGGVFGPSSSRLLDGNSFAHLALEARLATYFCGESALLFNSGYDANAGIWACLPSELDVILYDDLVHASVHDGMRLSRCRTRVSFTHNDLEAFEIALRAIIANSEPIRSGKADVWISIESLYSMDGDLAPLGHMAALLDEIMPAGNGHLVVDEAHATGLYGDGGRGLVCESGIADRVLIRIHTFGKSMACNGAVVLCNDLLRSYLVNYARPLIYSTVMPYINTHAISCSLDMFETGESQRLADRVHRLASHLLSRLIDLPESAFARLPSPLPAVSSPIIPIISSEALDLAAHLRSSGYLVRALRFPTVAKGTDRVRITLHAANTVAQVDGLLRALHVWLQSKGVLFQRLPHPVARL